MKIRLEIHIPPVQPLVKPNVEQYGAMNKLA